MPLKDPKIPPSGGPEETPEREPHKVDLAYLPYGEKSNQVADILRKGWTEIHEAHKRGDDAETERLQSKYKKVLIEMGVAKSDIKEIAELEQDFDEKAFEKTAERILKMEGAATDMDKFMARPPTEEELESETDAENWKLHGGRDPGES